MFQMIESKSHELVPYFFVIGETVVRAEELSCSDLLIEPLRSKFECLWPSIFGELELHGRELLGKKVRGTLRLHCDVKGQLQVFS